MTHIRLTYDSHVAHIPARPSRHKVDYNTRCASCSSGVNSVILRYGPTSTCHLDIFESDGLVTFQSSYEDAQGHSQPMRYIPSQITLNGVPAQADILTGPMSNGEIREVVLSGTRDGIFYRLTSRDTSAYVADLDALERVAESM